MENKFMENKLEQILNKVNNIERALLTVNSDLIKQNIYLSELLYVNSSEEVDTDTVTNTVTDTVTFTITENKELCYYTKNNLIIVHGSGTFDNKDKLKEHGSWNSTNKSWDLNISIEKLLEIFPNIINKEK